MDTTRRQADRIIVASSELSQESWPVSPPLQGHRETVPLPGRGAGPARCSPERRASAH